MTDLPRTSLRQALADDYVGLRRRLARRLGSMEFASEMLHEAWVRLDRLGETATAATICNPTAYLYRIALNIAIDRRSSDRRRLAWAELDLLNWQADEQLDPARIAEARCELKALMRALGDLPPRRRAIFVAARLQDLPLKVVAERCGVSVRIVDREIKAALDHVGHVVDMKQSPRRGPRPVKARRQ
jgi:RNA polymerase sigma-70 factor (ECF subfamily)